MSNYLLGWSDILVSSIPISCRRLMAAECSERTAISCLMSDTAFTTASSCLSRTKASVSSSKSTVWRSQISRCIL